MNPLHVVAEGRPLTLGRLIGKGGEGNVYAVAGDSAHVVKLYTLADKASREGKVAAMVRSGLAQRTKLIAFPVAVVRTPDGVFAGFVMKLMGGYRPLHELYAPGSRKHHFPQADYRFLVRAAGNVARTFASVHQSGCVVGDINHSGVLVSDKAIAALIDADSFQFTDGKQHFLCSVGVPEYTPPELQGKPLAGVVRTTNHDAFGLAVVLFQLLLMGRHPFVGTVRAGDIPPLHENIEKYRYAYADNRNVGMDQPPGTPLLSDFSPELARLFDRAFSRSTAGSRPNAQDWVVALDRFEETLVQCPENALHYGPKDASECAWCEMERVFGTVLFLPYVPMGRSATAVTDPGNSFDLAVVWARIERVRAADLARQSPRSPSLSLTASAAAIAAKEPKRSPRKIWGGVMIVAAIVLGIAAPELLLLAILLALWGYALFKEPDQIAFDAQPFRREFEDAQNHWYRELENWRRRAGVTELEALALELHTSRQRYIDLEGEERRLAEAYRSKRQERQLTSYLEGFDIQRSGVKGIGAGKMAALASYGVDTAADVTQARLDAVPGFGEVLINRLLLWRHAHERRFVYNARENDADRQEMARIRALREGKAAPLRTQLTAGAQELEQRARRVQEFLQREDPLLVKVHARVEQARQDLVFLGIEVPNIPAPHRPSAARPSPSRASSPSPNWTAGQASGPASTTTAIPAGSGASTSSGTPPRCPKCGSFMRVRLAKKGRNAGNSFWGCSRYPYCKGTRP